MQVVYLLKHRRLVDEEIDADENVYDTKLLGFFTSKEKCNEAILFYQEKPGFKDFLTDFQIEEIEADIDDYNDVAGEFDEFVYFLSHEWYDGEYDYVSCLGYYSDAQKAEEAKEKYGCEEEFVKYPEGFCIAKCKIGRMNWTEGFVSWDDEDE